MRSVTWNRFPISKIYDWFLACFICGYLNTDMRKFASSQKMKAEPSRLIPRKPTENLELLFEATVSIFLALVTGSSVVPERRGNALFAMRN